MLIYGALLIPILTVFILYRYYNKQTQWWEFFVPIGSTLIFVVLFKLIVDHTMVSCTEYWGSFITKVEYYEDWNEYVHRTCTRTVSCGKNCTRTYTYDCSYVRYHPAYWQAITSTGEVITLNRHQYHLICKKFGNEAFVNMYRHYYTNDGDKYTSTWPADSITAVPATTMHTYENRVKVADQSIFHFRPVTDVEKNKYQLKDYPEINNQYEMDAVIGYNDEVGNKKFQYLNALLGHKKQVRFFVLVFKNQPREAATYQQWYWQGANMNEFVICIGINGKNEVDWCKTISWTRAELLKTQVQDFVQNQKKLNLSAIAAYTQQQAGSQFVRRNFDEFNYLTVEPPIWAVVLTYVLALIINAGVARWVISNEHENERTFGQFVKSKYSPLRPVMQPVNVVAQSAKNGWLKSLINRIAQNHYKNKL